MPKPKKGEKKKDYIERCMSSSEMKKKFKKRDQRLAVCNDYWNRKK